MILWMHELIIWKSKIRSTSARWEHQMILLCGEKQNHECMGTCSCTVLNEQRERYRMIIPSCES